MASRRSWPVRSGVDQRALEITPSPGKLHEELNMVAALAYPHVAKDNGAPARLVSHPRTRVAMIITDYLAYGWSPDEICRQHPHLKLAEVHSAMAYYYDHQQEIDAEIAAELA